MLSYAQVGAGDTLRTRTDCTPAFDAACSNLRRAIFESSAHITHDALPHVQANASQITQLFQNLIGNAIKFRGEKAAVVHVGALREGANWVFSVTDQGIGIPPQHFGRIFEMFKRLHTHAEYSGTGIGLALCQKIVERHEGRIWVKSTLGQGATFFFTLPALPDVS
jgi:chemotaxis family two-component system sensor kinase Cph1